MCPPKYSKKEGKIKFKKGGFIVMSLKEITPDNNTEGRNMVLLYSCFREITMCRNHFESIHPALN